MREVGKQTKRRKRHITVSSGIEDRKGGDGDNRNWSSWVETGRKGIKKKIGWKERSMK